MATFIGIWLVLLIIRIDSAPSERQPRQSPFSRMSGGASGSPFHGPMGGPMGGNHMSPPVGGPSMRGPGQGNSGAMFHPSGTGCVRDHMVCPRWCLVEDSNGCKTCPCGPAGGMSGLVGGHSSNSMGAVGGGGPMSMGAGHIGGGFGGGAMAMMGGTPGSVVNNSGGGTNTGSGQLIGGGHQAPSTGSASYTSTSNQGTSSHISSTHTQTYVTAKPVKECAATLLCASTCKGHSLVGTSSSGCKTCSCPSSHHVSTTTINYIVQTVQPPQKECSVTSHCMRTCTHGYVMTNTDGYGCPECTCLKVEKPYHIPIEIAVEPPEYTRPVYTSHVQTTTSLTCHAHTCNTGCTVGYKCGTNGCPTCDCIHPAVVGMSTATQIYIEKPLACRNTLACASSCSLGYKCGTDGCPTCQCLYARPTYTQVRPEYTAQTCTHTLTCASTCTHGYQLFTDGTNSCYKCACKQQQVVYAVQRPGLPQVVQCPSTSSCASQCPHGYNIVQAEGKCPTCQCKPAPVHYTVQTSGSSCTDCHETSYYMSSNSLNSHSTGPYTGGVGYVVGSTLGTISSGGGTSYVRTGSDITSGGSYVTSGGATYCPPLPPDCQPSCIKYDDPHCRRCECETTYTSYSHG